MGEMKDSLDLLELSIASRTENDGISDEWAQRIESLESNLEEMQNTLTSLSLEAHSQKREEIFRSEFGYEKADEYFELRNFTVAGNGYLQFLEAHPDHPDARDVLQKARDAFLEANYHGKAEWVQTQVMERNPEFLAEDAYKMAWMLKQQRRYDEAISYIDQAAEAARNDVDRLWRRSYRAFLIQQRDGNSAGIDAYNELLKEIDRANLSDKALGDDARSRIANLKTRVANGNQ